MNLPNKISMLRIILIPFFMFFYMIDFIPNGWGKFVALMIFIVASLTDFWDGKLARKLNLGSNLGKFLDTIADKILVIAGLIMLIVCPININGNYTPIIYPVWAGCIAAIIIIARELTIGAFKSIASKGNGVIPPKQLARIKAGLQMVTLGYYIFYAFIAEGFYQQIGVTIMNIFNIVGYVLLGATVLLTIITAIQYFTSNKQVFKEMK